MANISIFSVPSAFHVDTILLVIFCPLMGSIMSPLEVQTLSLHSPVMYMIPVPMLSIQVLTYFPVMLS